MIIGTIMAVFMLVVARHYSIIICEQLIQRNLITDSYHANNERFMKLSLTKINKGLLLQITVIGWIKCVSNLIGLLSSLFLSFSWWLIIR